MIEKYAFAMPRSLGKKLISLAIAMPLFLGTVSILGQTPRGL